MTARNAARKILVCDDDETFVDILETLLRGHGYEVVTAANGFEGLEKLMEEGPDLLLLDLDMPNGNGFQLMEALSGHKAFSPSRIIVMSGYEQPTDHERARALGAENFMVKPVNMKHLLDEVRRVMGEEGRDDGAD